MNKEIICGIYKIENLINHKKYIGQSINIYDRWRHHKNIAQNPKDIHNSMIHQAFRKYGINNFSFEIIEKCKPEQLDNKEIYWIKYYHTWIEDPQCQGYNITSGGSGSSRKAIDQYDLKGNYITTFSTVTEAATLTNTNMANLSKCLTKKAKTANKFQWRYHDEDGPGPLKYEQGKRESKNNGNNPFKVDQYDKQGNYIATFNSAIDAAASLKNKPKSNHISECCIGKRKRAYGFIWKFNK